MFPRPPRLIPLLASSSAIALTALAGWSLRAGGQNPPPNPKHEAAKQAPAKSSDADKKENLADLDAVDVTDNQKTGVMTGSDFTYREEDNDTTISGSKFVYNRKTKILDAEGNLVMDDPKHHATCDKAHIDNSKKKAAFLTGHVVMVVKPQDKDAPAKPAPPNPPPVPSNKNPKDAASPKPHPIVVSAPPPTEKKDDPKKKDDANAKQDDQDVNANRNRGGTVTCDSVEDHYKQKYVYLRGHLVFKQTFKDEKGKTIERTLTAEHAEYDGKADKLILFAPVDGHDSQGQELHFKKDVTIGTVEGEETLESHGPVHLKGIRTDDEDTDADETKPTAAQGKPSDKEKPSSK